MSGSGWLPLYPASCVGSSKSSSMSSHGLFELHIIVLLTGFETMLKFMLFSPSRVSRAPATKSKPVRLQPACNYDNIRPARRENAASTSFQCLPPILPFSKTLASMCAVVFSIANFPFSHLVFSCSNFLLSAASTLASSFRRFSSFKEQQHNDHRTRCPGSKSEAALGRPASRASSYLTFQPVGLQTSFLLFCFPELFRSLCLQFLLLLSLLLRLL